MCPEGTMNPQRLGDPAGGWTIETAKARFGELVHRARTEGPQLVSQGGKDPVVVIAAEELARLLPPETPPKPFVEFMESLHVPGGALDLERTPDSGRDVSL